VDGYLAELTDKQKEGLSVLAGDQTHTLIYGGGRSGKTFLICYAIATRALMAPSSRHLIARRFNIDARQAVLMDTFPKMMKIMYPGVKYEINKQEQVIFFPDEAEVWFGGLDDAERIEKILGKEYATIYVNEASQVQYSSILTLRTRLAQNVAKRDGTMLAPKGYYDLNPTGMGHWTYKEFVDQRRPDNDNLPVAEGSRKWFVMNPADNPHLAAQYLKELDEMPERFKKRYRDGLYLAEVPNALWSLDMLEACRIGVDKLPSLVRVIVAVDPSGSDGVGGDSQGIIVAGLGSDDKAYVLADGSVKMNPNGWGMRVAQLARDYKADRVVAESNFGGAMVESTIRAAKVNIPYKEVKASRGKIVRAEPVSALYEQGLVKHVGNFTSLENQMAMFATNGYQGGDSPDRADALVWAITELMLGEIEKRASFIFRRKNRSVA
jgi:predicted phage terminase large subunit-like protein